MVTKGLKNLFTSQAVAASGKISSNVVFTGDLRKLDIYFKNTGTSTDCTIKIKGSPDANKTMESTLYPITLGASGSGSDKEGISIEKNSIPRFTWAEIINKDATNSAEITVTLDSPEWEIVSQEWN